MRGGTDREVRANEISWQGWGKRTWREVFGLRDLGPASGTEGVWGSRGTAPYNKPERAEE